VTAFYRDADHYDQMTDDLLVEDPFNAEWPDVNPTVGASSLVLVRLKQEREEAFHAVG
jgi:hypothetical protein